MKPTAPTVALLQRWHAAGAQVAVVQIADAWGSTPRERGAWMVVSADAVAGTIGGGRLEWDTTAAARAMLADGRDDDMLTIALGPAIGQCCGGSVRIAITRASDATVARLAGESGEEARSRPSIHIYGAGHVGRALARALAPLPFRVVLADSREAEIALCADIGVTMVTTDALVSLAEGAPEGGGHVVMTHSHAMDSLIAAALLENDRFGYLGIIGSRTKRNSFRKAFREMGIPAERIARVVCPIGGAIVRDKRPEVIAALTAAEIITALNPGATSIPSARARHAHYATSHSPRQKRIEGSGTE